MKRKDIKAAVKAIKEKFSSLSMEELIGALGIELKQVEPGREVLVGSPGCYCKIKGRPIIYLSKDCPEPLKAKVLAHELGHAVLHDVALDHKSRLFKPKQIEDEANCFAELLLEKG